MQNLVPVSLIALAIASLSVPNTKLAAKSEAYTAVVNFSSSVSPQAALSSIMATGANIESLIGMYEVEDRVITYGYVVEPDSFDNLASIEPMKESMRASFLDIRLGTRQHLKGRNTLRQSELKTLLSRLADINEILVRIQKDRDPLVDRARISGTRIQFKKLKRNRLVSSVESAKPYSASASRVRNDWKSSELNSSCESPWWPYGDFISTQESEQAGRRYVRHELIWSEDALQKLIDCHGDETTYEADATYNNQDGGKFLGDVTDWATDMPGSYLDTGVSDDPEKPTYTIGTEAFNNKPETRYFTYIKTTEGNSNTDTGATSGQRGNNNCPHPGTPSAGCVFGDASEILIPAWEHSVPGRDHW